MQASSTVVQKTISRLETIISVTVAGYIAQYLQSLNPQNSTGTILVAIVIFSIASGFAALFQWQSTIVTSIRSVMGVIVTTSIMHVISELGNSQALTVESSASTSILLLQSSAGSNQRQKYNLPVLLLGTVFVVGTGAIPKRLRDTAEGSAIYIGIQYAYSDILIMNFADDFRVKQSLAMMFLVLFPWVMNMLAVGDSGPLHAWIESIEFAGQSIHNNQ